MSCSLAGGAVDVTRHGRAHLSGRLELTPAGMPSCPQTRRGHPGPFLACSHTSPAVVIPLGAGSRFPPRPARSRPLCVRRRKDLPRRKLPCPARPPVRARGPASRLSGAWVKPRGSPGKGPRGARCSRQRVPAPEWSLPVALGHPGRTCFGWGPPRMEQGPRVSGRPAELLAGRRAPFGLRERLANVSAYLACCSVVLTVGAVGLATALPGL